MPYAAPNKYVQASFFAKKQYRSPYALKSTPSTAITSDCHGKFAMIICFCFNFLRILHSSAPKTIIWDAKDAWRHPTGWPRQTESLTFTSAMTPWEPVSPNAVESSWGDEKKIDLELSDERTWVKSWSLVQSVWLGYGSSMSKYCYFLGGLASSVMRVKRNLLLQNVRAETVVVFYASGNRMNLNPAHSQVNQRTWCQRWGTGMICKGKTPGCWLMLIWPGSQVWWIDVNRWYPFISSYFKVGELLQLNHVYRWCCEEEFAAKTAEGHHVFIFCWLIGSSSLFIDELSILSCGSNPL